MNTYHLTNTSVGVHCFPEYRVSVKKSTLCKYVIIEEENEFA